MSTTLRSYAVALLCLAVVGCGGSSQPQPEYPPQPEPATEVTVQADPQPEPPPPPPPVQVVAGTNTAIDGTPPTLRVTAPRNGQTIRSGDVTIRASLTNWELSPEGNHVHVIVDDEPYIAVRNVGAPINLTQLVAQNLGHPLADGSHVVRMFPSRGHHESVKTPNAFAVFTFNQRSATQGFSFDARAPLLTYSRPKGCNVLGQRVMLDFYVTNATLAAGGFRVKYEIDGSAATGEITDWVPHFIENLPAGEHTIHLTLLGADGQPVAGPFNDTTHTISVQETCAPPAAAAPAGAATAPASTPSEGEHTH